VLLVVFLLGVEVFFIGEPGALPKEVELVFVVGDPGAPPLVALVSGVVAGVDVINLSFVYTVKPAIGILETFLNFIFSSGAGGSYPEMSVGWVAVGGFTFVVANGLNCAQKFVPPVLSPTSIVGLKKYIKPNTTAMMIIKTIIKSIKFLFCIKIFFKVLHANDYLHNNMVHHQMDIFDI
jgi:hypothetical protein